MRKAAHIVFVAICACAWLSLAPRTRAETGSTELGGIALGSTNAGDILRTKGCRSVAKMDIDKPLARIELVSKFDWGTVERLWEAHRSSSYLGTSSFPYVMSQEVFLCSDRRLYIISMDYAQERVAAITFAFCSVDEESGAKLIYEKLGADSFAASNGFPAMPFFFPKNVMGDKLQMTLSIVPPRIDKSVYTEAYKKPDGCVLNFKPVAHLFALMIMSKPIMIKAAEKERQRERDVIEQIKPPPRL